MHKKRCVEDKSYHYASTERRYLNKSCHIDIWGPTKEDAVGYKYVLAMEEVYTRYCIFIPLKRINADIVVKTVLDRYVALLGIPTEIGTDLGRQFTSLMFKELAKQLKIKHDFTPKDFHSGNRTE